MSSFDFILEAKTVLSFFLINFSFLPLGFRGRSKPNLLRQETSSLLTALRLLYRMLADKNRDKDYNEIDNRLIEYEYIKLNYSSTSLLSSD